MSIVDQIRQRWWVLVVAVLAIGLIAAGALFMATREETATPEQDRGIEHARWQIRTFPAAAIGRTKKAQKARVKRQRGAVSEAVRDVYDALFSGGSTSAGRDALSRSAKRALKDTKVGLPDGADNVHVRRRVARIGIDVGRARRAAAAVKIVASGKVDHKRFRLVHRSRLWLERPRSRWHVIAYEMEQRRLK